MLGMYSLENIFSRHKMESDTEDQINETNTDKTILHYDYEFITVYRIDIVSVSCLLTLTIIM